MTSALVVSRFAPSAERAHGPQLRLRTLVEALARVVDRVDCLVLVPLDQSCGPDVIRAHEKRLRRLWSNPITVRFAPTVDLALPKSRWQRFAAGVFDFRAQTIARPTSTPATVAAVSAALDARPDIVLVQRLDR